MAASLVMACGNDGGRNATADASGGDAAEDDTLDADLGGESESPAPRDVSDEIGESDVADGADTTEGDAVAACLAEPPSGLADAPCLDCACGHCADVLARCGADPQCEAIKLCALATHCILESCLRPETCQAVIDAAGGLSSPSVATAVQTANCLLDHECGCIEAEEPACETPALGLGAAEAPPEEEGPYAVAVWKDPPGPPIPLTEGIFYPLDAPCPGAPVVLVHGGGGRGCSMVRMAQLLASRGLVAVVPSFPSRLMRPRPEHGDLINQIIDWTIAQGEDASTPLAGRVDGATQGVVGHSFGGVVFYAAATNPDIGAIVGFDVASGLEAAGDIRGPSLHLRAESDSQCGVIGRSTYDDAPPPKAMAFIDGASHCDFADPMPAECAEVCVTPPFNEVAAAHIKRYAVAWLVCLLGHDPAMASYVRLDGLEGLSRVEQEGAITCRPAVCE